MSRQVVVSKNRLISFLYSLIDLGRLQKWSMLLILNYIKYNNLTFHDIIITVETYPTLKSQIQTSCTTFVITAYKKSAWWLLQAQRSNRSPAKVRKNSLRKTLLFLCFTYKKNSFALFFAHILVSGTHDRSIYYTCLRHQPKHSPRLVGHEKFDRPVLWFPRVLGSKNHLDPFASYHSLARVYTDRYDVTMRLRETATTTSLLIACAVAYLDGRLLALYRW